MIRNTGPALSQNVFSKNSVLRKRTINVRALLFDHRFRIVILPRNKKMMQKAPSNGFENVVLHPNELLNFEKSFFIK